MMQMAMSQPDPEPERPLQRRPSLVKKFLRWVASLASKVHPARPGSSSGSSTPSPKSQMKRYLVHHEPSSGTSSARLTAELKRTFTRSYDLSASDVVTSFVADTNADELIFGTAPLRDDEALIVLPLADVPWFAHGMSPEPSLGPASIQEPGDAEDRERRLAIQILPADPDRFARDFERMLRVIAPYDCEVSRLLRVIRTPMSARTCGERLLAEGVLTREDRFLVAELTSEPWTARHAKIPADCERL